MLRCCSIGLNSLVDMILLFIPAAHRYKSHVLGVKLRASHETDRLGEPGIFVDKVRPGSIADGKLFPGDRIVAVRLKALSP